MISLAAFLIVCAALVATLALLVIVLVGSAQMRDEERKLTDRALDAYAQEAEAHEKTREAYWAIRDLNSSSEARIVPLSESEQVQRIAAVIAHNEAARMDPDVDWSARERGRR